MAFGVLSTNDYFEIFLKSRFPQRKIENLVAYGKPFMEEVRKSDELTGDVTYLPIQIDSPQGLGSTLNQANTAATSGTATVGGGSVYGVRAAITRAKYYALLTLDAETMLSMRNDEGAFFRARERNVTEIMEQLGQQLEMACWSKGNGSLGTISNEPAGATATATLVRAADSIKFHLGMLIDFYADSSGAPSGSARAGGSYTVSAINEDTGVITFSGNLNAAVAVGDHMVRAGDLDALIKGVPAWIPETAETTGTFFGMNRVLNVQKLQGHRQSWLGSVEETVKALDAKIRRVNKSKPKTLWVSYSNFNRLDLELGARGFRLEDGGQGKFGRPSLMMTTPGGGVLVKPGPYVPETAAWLLDMDSWSLKTLGPAPHLVQDDGNVAIRLPASTSANGGDGIEIRWRYFAQLVCDYPYMNGVASIS